MMLICYTAVTFKLWVKHIYETLTYDATAYTTARLDKYFANDDMAIHQHKSARHALLLMCFCEF